MLRKIHGTNFFHTKFLDRPNIKSQNGPVLPPAQVFYINGQALLLIRSCKISKQYISKLNCDRNSRFQICLFIN
jgi:hypothetical protein